MADAGRDHSATRPSPRRAARAIGFALALLTIPLAIGIFAFGAFDRLHTEEHRYRDARQLLARIESAASQQQSLSEHAGVMGGMTNDVAWRLMEMRLQGDEALAGVHSLGVHASFDELAGAWERYQERVAASIPDDLKSELRSEVVPHTEQASPLHGGGTPSSARSSQADPAGDVFSELAAALQAADEHLEAHAHEAATNWTGVIIGVLVLEALAVALLLRRSELTRRRAAVATAERALLADSEARFRSLVHNASDIVTVADAGGRITYESSAAEQVLGYLTGERVGADVRDYVHPGDRTRADAVLVDVTGESGRYERAELRVRHADGSWRWMDVRLSNLLDNASVGGIVLNQRDVSEQKVLEEELRHQALHDPLTDLPNRTLFRDRVVHAMERARRRRAGMAVLFVDLDNFKAVNDQLGHDAADLLLVSVAGRLAACLRPSDTAARLSGDEFGFLLEDVDSIAAAESAARRILSCLKAPFMVEGGEILIGASVGVALSDQVPDVERLLRNADFALSMAKSRGRRRFEVFDTSLHEQQAARFVLEAELRQAVQRHEFVVQYQPVADLASGRIAAAEALVRWRHPARGLLPPAQFIPLAEEVGLIAPIGRWVLDEACRQASWWRRRVPAARDLAVNVNVSARQLQQASLVDEIARSLEAHGLPPAALTVEITESAAVQDVDAVVIRLRELRRLGVGIALDDFGVGYSSLSYLRLLPIDVLKIDRSFIDRLEDEAEAGALVRAILTLARTLGLRTVAEGVASAGQIAMLREAGCGYGQGTHFSPPLDPEDLTALLTGATTAPPLATGR